MHGLQLYKVSWLYFAERPECVFTCVMNNCNITLQVNVRVTTMDAELEFAIQPNTTGKQLFDQVGTKLETFAAHPSLFFCIGCLLTSPQVSGWAVKLWAIQFCEQLKLKEKRLTRKRWSDWNSWPGRGLASAVNIFSPQRWSCFLGSTLWPQSLKLTLPVKIFSYETSFLDKKDDTLKYNLQGRWKTRLKLKFHGVCYGIHWLDMNHDCINNNKKFLNDSRTRGETSSSIIISG